MKEYAVILIGLAVVLIGALWATRSLVAPPRSGGVACTTEAKICPDGSAVGRSGPNCEFTSCPAATASSTSGGSVVPLDSGVRGAVSLGPTCPVMRNPPNPQCADKPYATAITVRRAGSSTPFVIGTSDATGAFKLLLPPGSYTVTAGSGTKLPRCSSVNVTVAAHAYTAVAISCDTGIR